jgi:CO/xanthine dehydrogenase Mo-binding subunit
VIRRRLRWHRASAQPLETAGAVCRFNPASGRMDVWSNTNMINYVGWLVANTLKVPASKLNINPMDVGGSFGSKHVLGKVIGIAAMLAKRAGRAVKFIEDRVDNLTACENLACDRYYDVELAVAADGIFTGLRIKWSTTTAPTSSSATAPTATRSPRPPGRTGSPASIGAFAAPLRLIGARPLPPRELTHLDEQLPAPSSL